MLAWAFARLPLHFAAMSQKPVKTRFAPSPTGLLHLGNVRTALFSYLQARHAQGEFLLRIEDTDAERGHEDYVVALKQDLRWLGLGWDVGPDVPCADTAHDHGPYAQSQRLALYEQYFDQLRQQGLAYPCFCSAQELKLERKAQLAAGHPPRYSGRCHRLDPQQAQLRLQRGDAATLRFHVAAGDTVHYHDLVRGPQRFASDEIGDFVIRRSNGMPAFFFSNAVDDALMGVTQVLRGEDHLTNTPRQLMLLQALDLAAPDYGHIALVVGADGAPLSKRHGSRSLQALCAEGFLPQALNNYLARLGHSYESNALMSLAQLAQAFSLERLHKAPARYDENQLAYWQKETLRQLPLAELWQWMAQGPKPAAAEELPDSIAQLVPADQIDAFVEAVRDNIDLPQEAYAWAANLYAENKPYEAQAEAAIHAAGGDFFRHALAYLSPWPADFKAYSKAVAAASGCKGKGLFMPLRAALSGQVAHPALASRWHNGPEMARLWQLLGEHRIRQRLQRCADMA